MIVRGQFAANMLALRQGIGVFHHFHRNLGLVVLSNLQWLTPMEQRKRISLLGCDSLKETWRRGSRTKTQ